MTPDALAAIHAAAFTDPRPWSADEIGALLQGPGAYLVTAPEGFAIGRVILDEVELLTIAVLPQARGRGVGARLLAGIEAGAVAHGARQGYLEVSALNAPARALYTRAGWADCGRRKGYYRDATGAPCDAVLMVRTFAQPKG